jgi:hypothetical protein
MLRCSIHVVTILATSGTGAFHLSHAKAPAQVKGQ